MDEQQLLATLADPEFTEALEVIKGYTTEQKQRHAYDMCQNYHHLVASYKREVEAWALLPARYSPWQR